MQDGSGLAKLYPPLNNADFLDQHFQSLPSIIMYGLEDSIVVNGIQYNLPMDPHPYLSPVEVTNICNYVLNAWDNDLGNITINDVKSQLKEYRHINERN